MGGQQLVAPESPGLVPDGGVGARAYLGIERVHAAAPVQQVEAHDVSRSVLM